VLGYQPLAHQRRDKEIHAPDIVADGGNTQRTILGEDGWVVGETWFHAEVGDPFPKAVGRVLLQREVFAEESGEVSCGPDHPNDGVRAFPIGGGDGPVRFDCLFERCHQGASW
jgi:hypothetical protein